jgi:BirA family transcriptional regulator, biotin operon repressor / biotin---[acetyl-CoA-carboxylase] ligase
MTSQPPLDPLDPTAVARTLLSRTVSFHPECESTNAEARRLALAGEPEGALVIADYQSAGRGRLDRAWQAPAGSSLLFSLLLRPPLPPARALQAAMAVSLGVTGGIRLACGLPARLKWPNDILINGRKAGGMLCELGLEGERLDYAIVGVGLNVNFDPQGVAGIPPEATSLLVELGRPQSRAVLLRAILKEMEPLYRTLLRGGSLRAEWSRALETLGRYVRVTLPEDEIAGMAETVDENGALIVRLRNRIQRTISAGDVVHMASEDTPWLLDHRA